MKYTNLELEVYKILLNSDFVLKNAFALIYENYKGLSEDADIKPLLPLLQLIVQQVDDNGNYSELFEEMKELLDAKEIDKNVSIKIVYQILHSLKQLKVIFDYNNLTEQLTTLLLENEAHHDEHLNANLLTCLKMCCHEYCYKFLFRLWTFCHEAVTKNHHAALQITVQLYDEFHIYKYDINVTSPYWSAIVQKLLMSNDAKDRKIAQYLLEKHVEYHPDEHSQYWCVFNNILVSLETNQSHLILPALNSLNLSTTNLTEQLTPWQNVLYIRILQQQNLPVLRCIIEHILENYTCNSLNTLVLTYFLNSLNKTAHYNPAAYCLNKVKLANFINVQNQESFLNFLKVFVNINWSSVPLFCLLEAFPTDPSCISFEQLLQLAACIRRLQHTDIREKCSSLFWKKFEQTIMKLLLHEYVRFTEALFNLSDSICASFWKNFIVKLKLWKDSNYIPTVNFTERFYRILVKSQHCCPNIKLILDCFQQLDLKELGWMRYFFLFDLKNTITNYEEITLLEKFCLEKYSVDLKKLQKLKTVEEIMQAFSANENSTAQDKTHLHEQAIDFFTQYCLEGEHVENMEIVLYLIENGTKQTLYKIRDFLNPHVDDMKELDKMKMAECFIKSMKQNDCKKFNNHDQQVIDCCLKLNRSLTQDFCMEILKTTDECYKILKLDVEFESSQYMELILYDDILSGDARIESMYRKKNHCFRYCIENILKSENKHILIGNVVNTLLQRNLELFSKKPRYFLDSREHRQQLIIANSIWILLHYSGNFNKYSQNFFHILHNQNNQSNVTLFYEDLAAKSLTNLKELCEIFEKHEVIRSSTSIQTSMLSVLHMFCKENRLSSEEIEKISLQLLLPFTMGANFQIRSCSILILQDLLQNIEIPKNLVSFKKSIENISQLQGLDKNNLIRMLLPALVLDTSKINKDIHLDEIILFVTDAPGDLFDADKCKTIHKLEEVHRRFKNKEQLIEDKNDCGTSINIQRKMQINDLYQDSCTMCNTTAIPNVEMFVVASLIDKLPNLGGIARTCEVLGIQNLVMHNKLVVEKADFKSLSMTAEKSLNIIEVKKDELPMFLNEKSNLGFQIIGAEQTSESVNFVNFTFPKKCILLLGHEKEGIPPTLIPFLNSAVEIPQFGKVRSLNVHVTASIFMWEFCKQHIYKKL